MLLCAMASTANAQLEYATHYTTRNGLKSNKTRSAYEDKEGNIWIPTDKGIVRFNGKTFKTFTKKDGLLTNDIFASATINRNEQWLFDYSFSFSYIKKDTVYITPIDRTALRKEWVTIAKNDLYKHNGGLVTSSVNNMSFLTYKDKQAFTTNIPDIIKSIPGLVEELPAKYFNSPSDLCSSCTFSTNGKKIALTVDSTLILYDVESQKKKRIEHNDRIYFDFSKQHISPKFFNKYFIWVSLETKKITFLDLETYKKSSINLLDYDKQYKFAKVHQIYDDTLFSITTNNNKFILINNKVKVIDTFSWDKTQKINNITKDKQGSYWASTFNNGIYFVSKNLLSFKHIHIKGINSRIVSMYEHDNKYFLFDNESRLFITTKNFNIIKTITFPILKKSYPEIKKFWFFPDMNSGYYIASAFGIYYLYKDYRVKNIDGTDLHVSFKDYCYNNTTENLFIAHTMGIAVVDKKHGFSFTKERFLPPKRIMHTGMLKNKYWNSNDVGQIIIVDTSLKEPTIINLDSKIDFSAVDSNRFIFSLEDYAIYCYDYSKNKVTTICRNEDFYFYKKSKSSIWVANEKYIMQLKWTGNQYNVGKKYLNLNGLLYNEVYDISECSDASYLVCDKGIICLPQDDFTYKDATFTESAYFKSLQVGNETSYFFSPNDTVFSYTYTPDGIQLQFSANSTAFLGNIDYRYFIEGSGTSWQTTNEETINYPALSPGTYKIHLKAKVNDLDLETDTKTFTLIVQPRWWQSLLFKLLVTLVILGIVVFLFYLRVKAIRASEQKQSSLDKKMAELELTALQSQMNPHFIFNSLTSVQSFINTNRNEDADWLLRQFSLLIRLYLEFSRSSFITIDQELRALKIYTDIERMRFGNKFEVIFKVRNQLGRTLDNIHIPPMLLQPLVENAINHGLYHRKDNSGILKVYLLINVKGTIVIIDDNGIGRDAAKKLRNKIFPSVGNQLINDRIKTLNESGRAKASIEILDKMDDTKQAKGTRVILKIINEHYDISSNN